MAAIYSNGGNRWNILGFNFTKRDALSSVYKLSMGESGFVVLCLIEKLEEDKHKLFFDNFFSSPELMEYLTSKGFWALATLNANRSRKCPLPSESELKKSGRDSSAQNVNKERSVVVTSWYDPCSYL